MPEFDPSELSHAHCQQSRAAVVACTLWCAGVAVAAQASAELLVAAEQALGGLVGRLTEALPSLDSCAFSLAELSAFTSNLAVGTKECSHTSALLSLGSSKTVVVDSLAALGARDPVAAAIGLIGKQGGVESATLTKLVAGSQ